MQLVLRVYNRINRRKNEVRIVRWSMIGEFHLVKVGLDPGALCGVWPGRAPERYIRGEHDPAEVCEACWAAFREGSPVDRRRLL